MYIRTHAGQLIRFDWRRYRSEKQMYRVLWKIMYNIDLKEMDIEPNKELIGYITK